MSCNTGQIFYYAKKLFRLYQNYQRKQQQQGQGQQSGHGQYQQGGQYGQSGQYQQQGQSYPPQNYQSQPQQPQQNHYQQSPPPVSYGQYPTSFGYGGGYGSGGGGSPQHALSPIHPGHQNQDMINATNQQYTSLRNQASHEANLMGQCFDKARVAHERGDGAAAHQFSTEGHTHQQKKDQLNHQAAQWIFNENNKHSPPGTIDLHGLYVQEAIDYTEQAIQQAKSNGATQLIVISGKGIHSPNHIAKVKPAIEQLMMQQHLSAHVDPHNTGRIIINMTGGQNGAFNNGRDMGFVDEISNRSDSEGCIIM